MAKKASEMIVTTQDGSTNLEVKPALTVEERLAKQAAKAQSNLLKMLKMQHETVQTFGFNHVKMLKVSTENLKTICDQILQAIPPELGL